VVLGPSALLQEVFPGLGLHLEGLEFLVGDTLVIERNVTILSLSLAEILMCLVAAYRCEVGRQLFGHIVHFTNRELVQKEDPRVLQNVVGIVLGNRETVRQKVHYC